MGLCLTRCMVRNGPLWIAIPIISIEPMSQMHIHQIYLWLRFNLGGKCLVNLWMASLLGSYQAPTIAYQQIVIKQPFVTPSSFTLHNCVVSKYQHKQIVHISGNDGAYVVSLLIPCRHHSLCCCSLDTDGLPLMSTWHWLSPCLCQPYTGCPQVYTLQMLVVLQ